MANNKRSFVMMTQWGEQLKLLNDEQRGILLAAIYDYQLNGNDFETDDGMLAILWSTIRQVFIYNDEKYAERCEKNRIKANKRWSKNNATASAGTNENAEYADNDNENENENENDNDNENDNVTDNEEVDMVTATLNRSLDKYYSRYKEYSSECEETPHYNHPFITYTQCQALFDVIDEYAVERYLYKAHKYKTDDYPALIIRWALQDGMLL